jgi:GDP-4-dehydro-6-deoxy-D-mannose reductase
LIPTLHGLGFDVTGTAPTDRPAWLPAAAGWHCLDLRETSQLRGLPRDWWAVVHLAARSVPAGFESVGPVLENVGMTVTLLEHVRDCRFLCISSCHVYTPSNTHLCEDAPVQPRGRYGLSKLLTEQAALAFADRLNVRIARPFNHLGQNMPRELLAPSLISQVKDGMDHVSPLRLSGLDSTRDFIDVRDVVRAYVAILRMEAIGNPPVFNVCTGRPVRVGDIARMALKLVGSQRTVELRDVPRSTDDVPCIVGCPDRLITETGWRPQHSVEDSLRWMMFG